MKSLSKFIKEQLNAPDNTKAFVIIKPGFIEYADEIHQYITNKGFIMIDHTYPMKLSKEQAENLYSPHKDKEFYNDLCEYMTSDDVIASIWSFDNKKHPNTNTVSLMKEIKDHFRDKYGKDEMKNCMHSSDSLDNIRRESKIIFI